MDSDRNYFTLNECRALEGIARTMGISSYWAVINRSPDSLVYCLLCNTFICDYYENNFQRLLVSHMLKHLKLKVFI